jgi:hypothetical protein
LHTTIRSFLAHNSLFSLSQNLSHPVKNSVKIQRF